MNYTLICQLANRRISLAAMFVLCLFAAPYSMAANDKATQYYEDAVVRFGKKDYEGAIIQLKNVIQIDRKILAAQVLLGKAFLKNGNVAAAEVTLNEAMLLGAPRADVVIPLAQAYLGQGKQKLIFDPVLFALAGLPPATQMQILLLQAAANADVGELQTALKLIDSARALDPKSPDSWVAEVPVRIRLRQFGQASDAVARATALAPNSADALYQKGAVLHVAANTTGALVAYDAAIKADADHVGALLARAGLYIDMGRSNDAARDLTELQRLIPDEPRAAYLRALLAERDNKPEEARNALIEITELIDKVPLDFIRYRPQVLMLNGLAHFGLNEPEKARIYFEAFQKVQTDAPTAKLLAQIYLRGTNFDGAINVLEKYLKAQPEDGQAMALLGSALMAKGQYARATALMQQALQTRDLPEFRTVLGLSLLRGGQPGDAEKELEAAFKKDPRQTQAATSLITLYRRSGQPAKATLLADKLVKQNPANAGFLNLLGMVRGQAGNRAGSRLAFEEAAKRDPNFTLPRLNLARLDIADKAYDAAVARLNAILKTEPKNAEALFEMALVADKKGQPGETLKWLEQANALSGPREIRWGLALSDFHLRNGRPAPAMDVVKQVSARAPEDLAVLLAYAKTQLANRDPSGAKSTLTTATRVADYNPQSQLQIALLQLSAANPVGATYSLEKALSKQPDFLPAQALMTDIELRHGDTAKAEARAKAIIAKNPKRAIGYSLLGDVATARQQTAPALEAYRKAHQIEPSTDTLVRLFAALAGQDGGKPAVQLAEQWLKAYPKSIAVHKALADHYARNNNLTAARTSYDHALKVNPDDGEALNNLANVLLMLKDPGAVKVAERAVAKSPTNANAIDTLGWALFQTGHADRALPLLRDARSRSPANTEIRYHLATVLVQLGKKTDARDELDAAFKADKNFEKNTLASALLKSLR